MWLERHPNYYWYVVSDGSFLCTSTKNEQLVVLLLKIMLSTLSNNVVESESACLCYAASSQFLARY